jgi:hypothetical protein
LVSVSLSFPEDPILHIFFENRFTGRPVRREQSCRYLKTIKIPYYAGSGPKYSMRREMRHFFEILTSDSDSPLYFASDIAPKAFPVMSFAFWDCSSNAVEMPSKCRRNRCGTVTEHGIHSPLTNRDGTFFFVKKLSLYLDFNLRGQ